jgi:1-acyl-sn-glycerol-3-phosphate acyltransferase
VFFYLFPIGTVRILFDPKCAPRLRKQNIGLLFTIIGQRLKVIGLDNFDEDKQYVIVSNYPGSYSGFALMNLFPDTSVLVHSFFSRVPIVGFLLKSIGAIFVQQKKFGKTKRLIDQALDQIKDRSIIILPEGGRSPDGSIRKFRHGFIYVLRNSEMELLPVTLNGFYTLKPLKRPYLDPDSLLEVMIHKPIDRFTIDSLENKELLKLTTETIQKDYMP